MDDATLLKRIIIVAAASRQVPPTAVVMHESVFFHSKVEGKGAENDTTFVLAFLLLFGKSMDQEAK